jgi:CRP/FNR family transcriptional regulator
MKRQLRHKVEGGLREMKNQACHHQGAGEKACVSLVPIFNHLEQDQMAEIMEVVQSTTLKRHEFMYHVGDASDSLYIVHHGRVKIYRLSESGKEQLVRILNPGDFTGELALFRDATHKAFAEVLVESEICIIQRDALHRLLLKYPTISLRILTEFSNRLEMSERQTTRIATESVEERIAVFLVESMEDHSAASRKIKLPMSKKDLASYLGTTPETLSRKLTEFEEAGYIRQKGQREIEIVDVDGLLLV